MKNNNTGRYLDCSQVIHPRFSEIDAMGVMWHGHHVKFFEDLREVFGHKHGMSYMDVYAIGGFMTPVVHLSIDYKRPLKYNRGALVKARFLECRAAKIVFEYEMLDEETGEVCATAQSVQVFIDKEGTLQLTLPEFYREWRDSLPWQNPES